MLNPIDTASVIREGGAVGIHRSDLHEGVAWWLGSCLVVTHQVRRLLVAHSSSPLIATYADRLCRGATNARHYACEVTTMGARTEEEFLSALQEAPVAGAWLSDSDGYVRIRLHGPGGEVLQGAGLATIRDMISRDLVPIPVNDRAKGTIRPWQTKRNRA
ncbi:hypothetical protein ABZ863_35155 [Saccharomonospora sp. NPDC046836]|uniref:hypothetical protein n=1 Tax=Saccharomonospora sp. NPDC046836 TaxID=3156921 RepID=UPI003410EF27